MTNSIGNNGNPFGSADYYVNKDKILNTGLEVWEYEGGYSYHGKSFIHIIITYYKGVCIFTLESADFISLTS